MRDPESLTLTALKSVDLSTRFNMRLLCGATLACALLLQISRFKTPVFWATTGLLLATSAYSLGLEIVAQRGRALTTPMTVVAGLLSAASALAATAYLSPLSSVTSILVVLASAWGLGGVRPAALAVYLTCAIGFLAIAALALVGVLPANEAQLAPRGDNPRALVGLTVLIEGALAIGFWLGRRTRAALEAALDQALRAEREMHRSGLLLAEARAELENVMAGARLGSLSGAEVGPYRVEEVIGRGGMGEVYRAVNRATGEACALKVLHAAALEDPTSLQRFFREAEVSSSLDSPHIVRVHATGTTPEGLPYIAMELLTGCDLARLLQQHRALSAKECAELLSDLARALGAARRAGIVHRDIKPQNVFRAEKPGQTLWKLLDFGVTKLLDGASRTLTRGAAVGTPAYMSPEQVRGMPVDHRSDVFSLGVVAYRAVTGQPAFTGPDHLAIMYQVYHQQPQQPSSLVALHPDVDLVFAIALAKDRDARFETAEALATAFADAALGRLAAPLRSRGAALVRERPWRNIGAEDLTVSETGAGAAAG